MNDVVLDFREKALTRDDVIARISAAAPQLKAMGVHRLFLYGSHARDQARPDSDIDIFIDPESHLSPRQFDPLDVLFFLESVFPGKELGFGTRGNIDPLYRPVIERTAIRIL
jgi:hypothetical protein